MTSSARARPMRRVECWTPPPPGISTERRLGLTENRRLARSKAHVARQHELAAGGAYATLDLRDGDEAACAQMAKQQGDRGFAGQLRCLLPVLFDLGHVDVGNEIVGVRALEHEHLDGVVGLGSLNEGDQIAHQLPAPEDSWAGPRFPRTERPLPGSP